MATSFDITGHISAVVSAGSLAMLKKLQKELREVAKAMLAMGDKAGASALGHTALAIDKVAGAAGKAADSTKKLAASAGAAVKSVKKLSGVAEKQAGIAKEVAQGWKLNVVESQALNKAVGMLGKKYTYATDAQKEWVPALKSSLSEINKQKVALVASGRAITTHVTKQELFDRVNTKLAAGVHKVSGKLTDYDDAMRKSLGRSPAFRSEVDKIAGAVGKQGEAFKSQFSALTKADNLWRKHVTNLHRAGEVTTTQANKMYAAYDHLRMPLSALQQQLKGTTQKASLFSRAMSSLTSHMKSFAAYAAAASVISGIAAMFGLAVRSIVQYDQALHDLQAITQSTDRETALMGERIREIGRTTKFSASEVAVAMRTLGQAGFTASEAIASIGDVADLATGTLTSMKTVVDLISTAMRAFDMKATESGRVADIFANAVNRSKLTIDKLRIAFNYIGPIAAKAGISLEETATTAMMLSNAGIRASTSGTGLRRTIQQLIEPTKEFKAALESAGYTTDDFNPKLNDMRDIIRRLAEVVPDAEAAFKMFALRSASVVTALSSQGVEGFDKLNSAVNRTGTASAMAAKQIEGLGIIFKQARDKAQDLALAFGEVGVSGALKVVGKALQGFFDGLRYFVSSGVGEAIIKIGALVIALTLLSKVWIAIKMSYWATAVGVFAISMLEAGTAAGVLSKALLLLQSRSVLILVALAALYAAYKLYGSVFGVVEKVSTKYIDDLDEIHKKELERLETTKRLVSIVRDELASNQERSRAFAELITRGIALNTVIDEATMEVEDLTEAILSNRPALDAAAQSFDNYAESARMENLEAQIKLHEEIGKAIEKAGRSRLYWHEQSMKLTTGMMQSLAKIPLLGGLVSGAFWLMRKKVDSCTEGVKKLEAQERETFEKLTTEALSFGQITQEVWKRYMENAGASEEVVVDLFTDGKEKITRAHIEAYKRIQDASEDMTAAERRNLDRHVKYLGDLFDKVNNTTAQRLEKDLREIREHYSKRKKELTMFYTSDFNALQEKIGYEAGAYEKLLNLIKRYSAESLAIVKKQYEDEKALIISKNLGLVAEQEKLVELDKKTANKRLAVEKDISTKIIEIAEKQLEVISETYERNSAAYDASVDRRIASIDKSYEYEKKKLELQSAGARAALLEMGQYAVKLTAIEANESLQRVGIVNEYVRTKKDATTELYNFEANLARQYVDLEKQYFDEIIAIGKQAKEDRLTNEEAYHEEQLRLVESAQGELADVHEEGSKEYIKEEEKLNKKLVEINRASTEKRLEILNNWSAYLSAKYDEAVGNSRNYANKVIALENEIANVRKQAAEEIVSVTASTEDKILQIRRAGMSATQIIWSKIREAARKLAEADYLTSQVGTEAALIRARKLYGEAQTIYTALGVAAAGAAKEGKSIGITHQEAERLVVRTGNGIINTLNKEKDASIAAKKAEQDVAKAAQKSWESLAEDISEKIWFIQEDINHLAGGMEGLISSINNLEDKEVKVGANEGILTTSIKLVGDLWTNIKALQNKTVTVTVVTKHVNAEGTVPVETKQDGGEVGLARGGKLPGFGGGDRIKALLEAGEFVVNKSAVRKYGAAMFSAYNSMAAPVLSAISKPLKFAFGGFVGLRPPKGLSGGSSGGGPSIGSLSQVDKSIAGLSKAINALNLASSSLATETGITGRLSGESYDSYALRKKEAGEQEKLDPEDYRISTPSVFKNLAGELKASLKGVKGEDKKIIEEIIEVLTPSGISEKSVEGKLGGRKLPEVGDVESAVLSLEEKKDDLLQRKEELNIYLEDLKKVREFMVRARETVTTAKGLTATEKPYVLGGNRPTSGGRGIIAKMKEQLIEAEPILAASEFDTSSMKDKVFAYLDKQLSLLRYQLALKHEVGVCYGSSGVEGGIDPMNLTNCRPLAIMRTMGTQREKLRPIGMPVGSGRDFATSPNTRLWAGVQELKSIAESAKAQREFDRYIVTMRLETHRNKKEVLRDLTDKYSTQSDLMSEADSVKQDLTYGPMGVDDPGSVQTALKDLTAGRTSGLDFPSLEKLRLKYHELAAAYFAKLPKFATGGFVDNILARLSPGEFVLRAEAVSQLGVPFLNALNNFKVPVPAYAQGGLVDSAPSFTTKNAPSVQRDVHLNINITGAGEITEKQVRKWVYPAINKLQRLER